MGKGTGTAGELELGHSHTGVESSLFSLMDPNKFLGVSSKNKTSLQKRAD